MTANRSDIDIWIKAAKNGKYKYVISVCDTFDYDDYPVYCKDDKELAEKKAHYESASMQKINEVITINEDGNVTEQI